MLELVFGFFLNCPVWHNVCSGWVTLPLKRKHWVTLKHIQDAFYNLDSKLKAPQRIGTADQFVEFLRSELRTGDKELFLVVDRDVAESAAWKTRTM